MAEELAVLLVADLGETARGVTRPGESETAITVGDGNRDGRPGLVEITLETVGRVTDAENRSSDIAPLNIDRHGGVGWGTQERTIGQAVGNGGPVEDSDAVELQLGRALAQVNIDSVEPDYARSGEPEQTAGIASDVAGVVGVD